jgi:hypothetical protein
MTERAGLAVLFSPRAMRELVDAAIWHAHRGERPSL